MKNDTPPPQAEIVTFAGELIQKTSRIHLNLGQEFVLTTDDKIRLCLNKHLSRVEKRNAWITPLGVLLTIIIVFPTTTFQPFVCSAETWEAVFIVSGVICLGWLVRAIWQSRVATSIDSVIDEIKRTAIANDTSPTVVQEAEERLSENAQAGELVIRSATYGAGETQKDVTEVLKSKVQQGKLQLEVTNDNLGGDPVQNVVKTLSVTYSYAGEARSQEITEHKMLSLP